MCRVFIFMTHNGALGSSQHVQRTNATISHGGASRLHDGSVVQGRVLASHGAGAYTVSIAGQQVSVRSQVSLTPGNAFSAQIQVRDNVITLVLQQPALQSQEALEMPSMQTLLTTLGLPVTAESARLLLFAQELGIKIKPEQLKKALLLAKRFTDGSSAAAISVLLDDKGLSDGADAVSAVLAGGGDCGGKQQREQHGKPHCKNKKQNPAIGAPEQSEESAACSAQTASCIESSPRAFVDSYLHSADSAACAYRAGALTAFNQLARLRKTEDAQLHWLLLPFEWNFRDYSGVIRLLWDASQEKICKISVTVQNFLEKFTFVGYYIKDTLERITFCTEPLVHGRSCRRLEELLSNSLRTCTGQDIAVCYTATLHSDEAYSEVS